MCWSAEFNIFLIKQSFQEHDCRPWQYCIEVLIKNNRNAFFKSTVDVAEGRNTKWWNAILDDKFCSVSQIDNNVLKQIFSINWNSGFLITPFHFIFRTFRWQAPWNELLYGVSQKNRGRDNIKIPKFHKVSHHDRKSKFLTKININSKPHGELTIQRDYLKDLSVTQLTLYKKWALTKKILMYFTSFHT